VARGIHSFRRCTRSTGALPGAITWKRIAASMSTPRGKLVIATAGRFSGIWH
jgi:hypothetical protein